MSTVNPQTSADSMASDSSGYQWAVWCLGVLLAFGLIAMIIVALVLSVQNRYDCDNNRRHDMIDTCQLRDGAVTFPKLDSIVSTAILAGGSMSSVQCGVIPMTTDSIQYDGPVSTDVILKVPATTNDYNILSLTDCVLYTSNQTTEGFKCSASPIYSKNVPFLNDKTKLRGSGMSLSAIKDSVTWATHENINPGSSKLSFWGVPIDSDISFPSEAIGVSVFFADFTDNTTDIFVHYGPKNEVHVYPSYSCIVLARTACLNNDNCYYVTGNSLNDAGPITRTIKITTAGILNYENYDQNEPLGSPNGRYLDFFTTESGYTFLKISSNVSNYKSDSDSTPVRAQLTSLVVNIPGADLDGADDTNFCNNSLSYNTIITGDLATPTAPSYVTTARLPQSTDENGDQVLMCRIDGTSSLTFKVLQLTAEDPYISDVEKTITYQPATCHDPDFENIATACCFGDTPAAGGTLKLYILWSAPVSTAAGQVVLVRYRYDPLPNKFFRENIMLNETMRITTAPQQMAIEEVDDPWNAQKRGVQITCYDTGRLQIVSHAGVTGPNFITRPTPNMLPFAAIPLFIPEGSTTPKACISDFITHLSKQSGSPLAYMIG